MKIVFLTDDFPPKNFGGAGIVTHTLAKGLVAFGHDVFVITTVQDKHANRGWRESDGMKVYDLYNDYDGRFAAYVSLYNPKTVGIVDELLREIKPDVVHAHNIHNNLSYHTLAVAHRYTHKIFLTTFDAMSYTYGKYVDFYDKQDLSVHTHFSYKLGIFKNISIAKKRFNPFRNSIIRWYLNTYTKKIFPVSHALGQSLIENGIQNVVVIQNGVDPKNFTEDPLKTAEFKKTYELEDKKVVFFAGRISWAKGGEAVLDAVTKVAQSIPNVCLMVIGSEDGFAAYLKDKAKRKGVTNNTRFISWLDRASIISAYYASSVVVVPSLYLDPFPTINLEAMSASKPVVGTCFGGTPEIVVDGKTGIIVNPNNIDMFASALQKLLSNEEYAKKLGEAGRERIEQYFNVNRYTQDTIDWYQRN